VDNCNTVRSSCILDAVEIINYDTDGDNNDDDDDDDDDDAKLC